MREAQRRAMYKGWGTLILLVLGGLIIGQFILDLIAAHPLTSFGLMVSGGLGLIMYGGRS